MRLFGSSAFRLETLPQYRGTSDAALQAFLEGRPLPLEQRPAKQRWMRLVADAAAAGKRISRVHVVSRPLTPYERYELAAFPENAAAGEQVLIADRGEHPELAELTGDFWLLDDTTDRPSVLLMDYDAEGRFRGQEHTRAARVLADCRRQRDLALACSVDLDEFLAVARR